MKNDIKEKKLPKIIKKIFLFNAILNLWFNTRQKYLWTWNGKFLGNFPKFLICDIWTKKSFLHIVHIWNDWQGWKRFHYKNVTHAFQRTPILFFLHLMDTFSDSFIFERVMKWKWDSKLNVESLLLKFFFEDYRKWNLIIGNV